MTFDPKNAIVGGYALTRPRWASADSPRAIGVTGPIAKVTAKSLMIKSRYPSGTDRRTDLSEVLAVFPSGEEAKAAREAIQAAWDANGETMEQARIIYDAAETAYHEAGAKLHEVRAERMKAALEAGLGVEMVG